METIYRVESTVTGRGFYNHNHHAVDRADLWAEVYESTFNPILVELMNDGFGGDDNDRPHPHLDGLGNFTQRHYFGFNSLSQMVNWFPRRALEEIVEGALSEWFSVVAYTVDEEFVLRGGRQVAFEKAQAHLRHELTKDELSWLL